MIEERRQTVVVTGICGRIGRRLANRLRRSYRVIGLDTRPYPGTKPPDVEHVRIDIRRKAVETVFRKREIDALIHLGIVHDPAKDRELHYTLNVRGTARTLAHCHKYGIPKIILLSSADLYGPRPENPQFLNEEAPLMATSGFPQVAHLVQVDLLFQSMFWKAPEIDTVILRPVHVVGGVHNGFSVYLRQPVVPVSMGYDPVMQVIHEDDLVEAVVLALRPGIRGIFNLAGEGVAPLSKILDALGRKRIPVPHPIGRWVLKRLWSWGISQYPPGEAEHLRYQCMVDTTRAREVLGFEPRYTMEQALEHLKSFDDLAGGREW